MSWLSNLLGKINFSSVFKDVPALIAGIPWVKVAIGGAILGFLAYEVELIRRTGEDEQIITDLQAALKQEKINNDAVITALKDQAQRNAAALEKERNDAVKNASDTQALLDHVKNSKPGDDGPVHPVITDTFNILRGKANRNSGSKNRESPASSGASNHD